MGEEVGRSLARRAQALTNRRRGRRSLCEDQWEKRWDFISSTTMD
jgi:hypothetical protein